MNPMYNEPSEGIDRVWVFSKTRAALLNRSLIGWKSAPRYESWGTTNMSWEAWMKDGYERWIPENEMWELLG